ncbi:nucleotidyltransferase family protein [Pigmentiphaga aceris]|uniref:Nucleotidyltransferase family protein n=1 Tax=Pigmentiphaga aceris TaxID=1940612 RepID=A0A5C0B5Z0_9BURK|nr:nucleotidyltransferase family protein [Pigmentiphaga aceris]
MVSTSASLMAALRAARSLALHDWCIGAGAVRSLVWDTLHGHACPSAPEDIDVVYYDARACPAQDAQLEARLRATIPTMRWEVTNQAHVHEWFASTLGQTVAPFSSLKEGIATWPEYATCVGVYVNEDDSIGIVAPYGLDDLFNLRVRHNPTRASLDTYRQRVHDKRFQERWPRLSISME